jgi:hypothetical protein
MWLLLCDRDDLSALWLYRRLRGRGLAFELVTSELLAYALRWEHRLSSDGVSVEIELAEGRVLNAGHIDVAINRIATLPAGIATTASPADRDYALQELQAFWLSWLAALPGRVLNRASAQGLAGPWLDRTEWLARAAHAGLGAMPYHSTEPQMLPHGRPVLVVCGQIAHPDAPAQVAAGCRRLAELTEADLLGVEFSLDGTWRVLDATPYPDLSIGGETGVDLIAEAVRAA